MKLSFPNPSRSFDASKNRILFWGYDKAMEVSFSIDSGALKQLYPNIVDNTEKEFLMAFDTTRRQIYKVANQVYLRGNDGVFAYNLAAKDF